MPETFEIIQQWRELLKEYEALDGQHRYSNLYILGITLFILLTVVSWLIVCLPYILLRLLAVEAPDKLSNVMLYYGNESHPLADFPFNFELLALDENVSGKGVFEAVTGWLKALPSGMWPNWMVSIAAFI